MKTVLAAESELVGHAQAQSRRGRLYAHRIWLQRVSQRCSQAMSTGSIRCHCPTRRAWTPVPALALAGPELRTIVLGFDSYGDPNSIDRTSRARIRLRTCGCERAFLTSDRRGRDRREGDAGATRRRLPLLICPRLSIRSGRVQAPALDPEAAKTPLPRPVTPKALSVQLDCPNDRFVNDEAICQAIVGMLARVGVTVDLNAQTKSKWQAKILAHERL